MNNVRSVIIFTLLLSCISCVDSKHKHVNLNLREFKEALYSGQSFLLYQRDDSIGEWGGTEFYLKLRGNPDKEGILLDLKKVHASHEPTPPPNSDSLQAYLDKLTIIDTSNISLNDNQILLVMKSISELSQRKLVDSGPFRFCPDYINVVVNSDSTFFTKDCKSIPWSNFDELKRSLNIKKL